MLTYSQTMITFILTEWSANIWTIALILILTLSWRRQLSYRNESIGLQSKSMDWFLYDNGLCHMRVDDCFWFLSLISTIHDQKELVQFNPLHANPTKWSNTLKQFVSKLPTNCLSVFDHFMKLALKGLSVKVNIFMTW